MGYDQKTDILEEELSIIATIANDSFLPVGSFTFMGDATHKVVIKKVATNLGINWKEAQGSLYVSSKKAYEEIVHYIVEKHLPGSWRYVSAANFMGR